MCMMSTLLKSCQLVPHLEISACVMVTSSEAVLIEKACVSCG